MSGPNPVTRVDVTDFPNLAALTEEIFRDGRSRTLDDWLDRVRGAEAELREAGASRETLRHAGVVREAFEAAADVFRLLEPDRGTSDEEKSPGGGATKRPGPR